MSFPSEFFSSENSESEAILSFHPFLRLFLKADSELQSTLLRASSEERPIWLLLATDWQKTFSLEYTSVLNEFTDDYKASEQVLAKVGFPIIGYTDEDHRRFSARGYFIGEDLSAKDVAYFVMAVYLLGYSLREDRLIDRFFNNILSTVVQFSKFNGANTKAVNDLKGLLTKGARQWRIFHPVPKVFQETEQHTYLPLFSLSEVIEGLDVDGL